jgi:predicted metalloprotease
MAWQSPPDGKHQQKSERYSWYYTVNMQRFFKHHVLCRNPFCTHALLPYLMGTSDKVRQIQARADQATANRLSVRIELQADCFAGVWGHHTAERGIVNQQDVTTALQTAAQIGDDYLQRRARGVVVPETFTHGSSQQRVHWFEQGLTSGDIRQCDTFAAQ